MHRAQCTPASSRVVHIYIVQWEDKSSPRNLTVMEDVADFFRVYLTLAELTCTKIWLPLFPSLRLLDGFILCIPQHPEHGSR